MDGLVPFIVVVAWVALWYVVLRGLGFRLFTYWGLSAEKAAAWRVLRRWRYVAICVLVFGMGLFAFETTRDYEDGKVSLLYLREHHTYLSAILVRLAFCIGYGLLIGFSSWNRIWDARFDLPQR